MKKYAASLMVLFVMHNIHAMLSLPQDLKDIIAVAGGKDSLNLRATCTHYANLDKVPRLLYEAYGQSKYLHKECIFYDCVYKNKCAEVEWLLKNKPLGRYLHVLTSCYNQTYDILYPHCKSDNEEDQQKMSDLCSKYKTKYQLSPTFNYDLCIASCIGDVDAFEKELSCNNEKNAATMPLVIWAATKNCDISFLQNLLKHEDYKRYMEKQSDKYLRFGVAGFSYETIDQYVQLPADYPSEHIDRIKKLIDSECFDVWRGNYDCQFAPWGGCAGAFIEHLKLSYDHYYPKADKNPYKEIYAYALQKAVEIQQANRKQKVKLTLMLGGIVLVAGYFIKKFIED